MQMKMKCNQFGHMGAVQLCCQQLWWGLIWFGLTESISNVAGTVWGQKNWCSNLALINSAPVFPSRG